MDDRRQCRCGWRWRVGWFLSHWTWNSDLCTWYRPPTQQPTNTLKLHNLVGNVWNVLWGPRNVEPNIITATKYTFWVNFTKPGRVSSSCVMTTHLLLLKTVSNTGGSLFTIPRTLLPGVVAAFSSGQWSLLYLCSFTDNPGGGCVPRSNTAGAGEGCGVVVDVTWLHVPQLLFARLHAPLCQEAGQRMHTRSGVMAVHGGTTTATAATTHNTCWWGKNFQGRSARLSAQQQPTTVQIVVAVGPQQHRIQSTISHHTSWILMMLNIIAIVDCSSIKYPAAS